MKVLPPLLSDSYKQFHHIMYPKGMSKLYSNMTPRSSRLVSKQAVWFGINYYLKEYLIKQWNELFFNVPIDKVIAEYKRFHKYFSFTDVTVEHLQKLHELGYMPLKIKSLPEGSLVPMRVPFYTITNTHPDHAWLVNFLETQMSTVIWDLTTIATISYQYRLLLSKHAIASTGSVDGVQWQAHDFAMRGRSSVESSFNQAGHLLSFTGTDTIPAVLMLEEYYNADIEEELVGSSVPATEHSVMTSYGKENEIDAFRRLLTQFPTGILSIVSDSFDLWKVLTEYLIILKDDILARDGKIVLRPDSGDPIKIICGDSDATGPAKKGVVELLWDIFGGTTNDLGYEVLDSHIGAIYGDSITLDRADQICKQLIAKGFASTNIVLGVGSYTFNMNTRDSLGIAVKSTYCEISHEVTDLQLTNGVLHGIANSEAIIIGDEEDAIWLGIDSGEPIYMIEPREIFKDPITDDGTKKSAKGLLRVDLNENGYYLTDQVTQEQEEGGELITIFEDGELLVDPSLSDIRSLVNTNVLKQLKQI